MPNDMTIPTTLLRQEVVGIYNALDKAKNLTKETKYSWSLVALRRRLKPIIDALDEIQEEPEQITEFNKQKREVCIENSKKDPAGDPTFQHKPDGTVSFNIDPAKSEVFQAKMKELNETFKTDLDTWNAKIKEINGMMDEPAPDLTAGMLCLVKLSWFKADLPGDIIDALFPILHNDLEDETKK